MSPRVGFAFVVAACAAIFAGSAGAVVGVASAPSAAAPVSALVAVLARGRGYCTGVAISRDAVLTAAHCVAKPGDLRVHFKDAAGRDVLAKVRSVAIHPRYRAEAPRRRVASIDLAILRTALPLPARIVPARLAGPRTLALGDKLEIAGIGLGVEGDGSTGGPTRAARLEVAPLLSPILVTLRAPGGAFLGACEGDSGGPIYDPADGAVVGIVDWTTGPGVKNCGALTQGALVAPQAGWIARAAR
ncbi:MAG: S1 family peptidase [Hyphomicrobiales bacterium]|nr:S1 family peptidase [Hyphomicrobiales bacterium]